MKNKATKAYRVWHKGMLHNWPFCGNINNVSIVYADTPNKAKMIAREPYFFDIEDVYETRPIKYIDLRVRRAPEYDLFEFEGEYMTKTKIAEIKRQRTFEENRKKFVEKFSDDTMFYVQNGYVGNCILFWGLNNCGYTADIKKSQKYSKAEILEHFVPGREEDIIWEASHIEANIKLFVDGQYLTKEYAG